jgi:hypothetical protein
MNEECHCNADQTNTSLIPSVDFDIGGVQDVLAKDDTVSTCPTEMHDIDGVHASNEELGPAVDILEVVLLATITGDRGTEFEVHGLTGQGDEHTNNPNEEGETDRAREANDGRRSGKDTSTNHAIEGKEYSGPET